MPVKLKSRGFQKCGRKSEEAPLAADCRLLLTRHEGQQRAEATPCEEHTGNTSPATSQRHQDFFVLLLTVWREKKKLHLFSDHRGLMLAVLSEEAVHCHYCATVLIIDSIKMAVKLDVPISSRACCLF